MMTRMRFIPVSRPKITKEDVNSVQEAVASTYIAGGSFIPRFESALAKYCDRQYGVAVTNATSALYLAVKALSLPPKSRILVPSFTIISVLQSVILNGHVPVFADVDPKTWNISLKSVQKALRKNIAAAIMVETYASAPPMKEIQILLKRKKVFLIEDAAEGFGGSDGGRPFGSFGTMSILSFYANKLITTGEGGMILTDNKLLYDRLYSLRNLCFDSNRTFIHKEISGNYRMTNIQAALGLSQLKRIKASYEHRKKLYHLYLQYLAFLSKNEISFQEIPSGIESSYWVFPIIFQNYTFLKKKKLMERLLEKGIETRHFFYPLDRQPVLPCKTESKSVSYHLWQKGLYLPLGNGITEREVEVSAKMLIKLLVQNT
jgi:perosamine synthetase